MEELPDETLLFLLGSRYCETDRLSETAWQLFGKSPTGWGRVQAICDYVHRHITFGYEHARPTKTAWEAFQERTGVCRDYAHLAIAFCRCMNIPARYCTGYLGDIGVPPPYGPMDFAAWFEAYLDGHWYTFDAAQQYSAHRTRVDRPRPRRRRRRHQQHLRSHYPEEFQGSDRTKSRRSDYHGEITPALSRECLQALRGAHKPECLDNYFMLSADPRHRCFIGNKSTAAKHRQQLSAKSRLQSHRISSDLPEVLSLSQ